MLFYMEAQSHEEVAAMLAMPVGTVKTLLHRARARLSAAVGNVSASA
jgi:DNA-directed RNA polymerase specialized sigma24 family protein